MDKLEEVSSSNPSKFTLEELQDVFNEIMGEFEEVGFIQCSQKEVKIIR